MKPIIGNQSLVYASELLAVIVLCEASANRTEKKTCRHSGSVSHFASVVNTHRLIRMHCATLWSSEVTKWSWTELTHFNLTYQLSTTVLQWILPCIWVGSSWEETQDDVKLIFPAQGSASLNRLGVGHGRRSFQEFFTCNAHRFSVKLKMVGGHLLLFVPPPPVAESMFLALLSRELFEVVILFLITFET